MNYHWYLCNIYGSTDMINFWDFTREGRASTASCVCVWQVWAGRGARRGVGRCWDAVWCGRRVANRTGTRLEWVLSRATGVVECCGNGATIGYGVQWLRNLGCLCVGWGWAGGSNVDGHGDVWGADVVEGWRRSGGRMLWSCKAWCWAGSQLRVQAGASSLAGEA